MDISTTGIDLRKTTFILIGLSGRGEIVLRKKLANAIDNLHSIRVPLLIGMPAPGSLPRSCLAGAGHDARLMPAQYVSPL